MLCYNPIAVPLVEKLLHECDKVAHRNWHYYLDWSELTANEAAMHLIEKYYKQDKETTDLCYAQRNPSALPFLEKQWGEGYCKDWSELSANSGAIYLLEQNPDKIDYKMLSQNTSAIHIIQKNLDKIDWRFLSRNPNAIDILEKNQDKIDWNYLSENPNAIGLLNQNQDKIDWKKLSSNPSIFEWSRIKYLCKKNILKNIFNNDLLRFILDF
jgi:hypothetical protein